MTSQRSYIWPPPPAWVLAGCLQWLGPVSQEIRLPHFTVSPYRIPRISGIPDGIPSRNLAPPVLNFFNEFQRFDQRFAFHPCLKPPNVDLPTAAGDLVNNLGQLLCWQSILNFGQDGLEGSSGFEDHPQAKLPADSPDVLADT